VDVRRRPSVCRLVVTHLGTHKAWPGCGGVGTRRRSQAGARLRSRLRRARLERSSLVGLTWAYLAANPVSRFEAGTHSAQLAVLTATLPEGSSWTLRCRGGCDVERDFRSPPLFPASPRLAPVHLARIWHVLWGRIRRSLPCRTSARQGPSRCGRAAPRCSKARWMCSVVMERPRGVCVTTARRLRKSSGVPRMVRIAVG